MKLLQVYCGQRPGQSSAFQHGEGKIIREYLKVPKPPEFFSQQFR